ncbi:MAG: hypothetical protein RIG61_11620 [Deltaproteobacteria bacterium]
MKKLIIASIVAAGLSFPLTSQAEVSAFGVNLPIEQREVSENIRGGYVAQDLGDTFHFQTLTRESVSKSESAEAENVYTVFGVRVSGDNVI